MSKTAETLPIAKGPRIKVALDHARAAAQELHGALSDAVAKRGGAIKGDLESVPLKAKAVVDSIGKSMSAQNAAAKQSLGEATNYPQATAAHATEALKSSGRAAETSIQKALTDARTSVQKISEAVAAKRSAAPTLQLKK